MTVKKAKELEKLLIEKIELCAVGICSLSSGANDEHTANAIYNLVRALEIIRVEEDE